MRTSSKCPSASAETTHPFAPIWLLAALLLGACASGPTVQSGSALGGNEDCSNGRDDDAAL